MKIKVIAGMSLLAVIAASSLGRIPQNPEYHNFADQRVILSISNFWNVITNVPFIIVGVMGMILIISSKASGVLPELKQIYFLFFRTTRRMTAWYRGCMRSTISQS